MKSAQSRAGWAGSQQEVDKRFTGVGDKESKAGVPSQVSDPPAPRQLLIRGSCHPRVRTKSAEGTAEGCMRVMRAGVWSQTDMGSNPALALPGYVTLNRCPFSGI